MATLTSLKKKIAALEAQVQRVTRAEIGNAIAKIRKIMGDYGVTAEHLADGGKRARPTASKKSAGAKATKGNKPAKYKDPKSGATWSGLGRIPAWIAKAKNRETFLIDPSAAAAPTAPATAKSPAKGAKAKRAVKTAPAGKQAGVKAAGKKNAVAKKAAPAKKPAASTRTPAKSAAPKKATAKARKAIASKKASAAAPTAASADTDKTAS